MYLFGKTKHKGISYFSKNKTQKLRYARITSKSASNWRLKLKNLENSSRKSSKLKHQNFTPFYLNLKVTWGIWAFNIPII